MKLKPTFSTHIASIPCGVLVTQYELVLPWSGVPNECPSDLDYYGYTEFDFTVLDRKGYPASWLANKLTESDRDRILKEYQSRSAYDF
jgi:hypothetical protein